MVVFANHRLGPSAELLVSDEVARVMLEATADAARAVASARWERELALWLYTRAKAGPQLLDVSEIAWTPEHFEVQRAFLIEAIGRAALGADHALAFDRWRRLIEAHPRDSVQVGRRWQWYLRDTARDAADGGERGEAPGYFGATDLSLGR